MEKFKGGYTQMLSKLFPELNFDISKFLNYPPGRKFFFIITINEINLIFLYRLGENRK